MKNQQNIIKYGHISLHKEKSSYSDQWVYTAFKHSGDTQERLFSTRNYKDMADLKTCLEHLFTSEEVSNNMESNDVCEWGVYGFKKA